jgi:hypothetical protein
MSHDCSSVCSGSAGLATHFLNLNLATKFKLVPIIMVMGALNLFDKGYIFRDAIFPFLYLYLPEAVILKVGD